MVIVLQGKERKDRVEFAKALVERHSALNTDPKTLHRRSGFMPMEILSKKNQVKSIVSSITGYGKQHIDSKTFKEHTFNGIENLNGGSLIQKVEENLNQINPFLIAYSVLSFCHFRGQYVVVDFNQKEIENFNMLIRIIDITNVASDDNDEIDNLLKQFYSYGVTTSYGSDDSRMV